MPRTSAGLLLYRRHPERGVEVLVGHMGGPFWARKDAGAWSIPKGEYGPDEEPRDVALREFAEDAEGGWGELALKPVPGEPVVVKQYASAFFGTSLAATAGPGSGSRNGPPGSV